MTVAANEGVFRMSLRHFGFALMGAADGDFPKVCRWSRWGGLVRLKCSLFGIQISGVRSIVAR